MLKRFSLFCDREMATTSWLFRYVSTEHCLQASHTLDTLPWTDKSNEDKWAYEYEKHHYCHH